MGLAIASRLVKKEVVSAYNANKEGDFASAATTEQAILNPKANVKIRLGDTEEIYLNISRDGIVRSYPDALVRSRDSYMKAQELDKKGSYASEIQIDWGSSNGILQHGHWSIQHRGLCWRRGILRLER